MNVDNIAGLIIAYLNQSTYLESKIQSKDVNRYISYRGLYFRYSGNDIEIRIHNPEFIEMKVGGKFGCVCDCIGSVRKEIDKLVGFNYR